MENIPTCATCAKGKQIIDGEDVLCEKKGIVAGNNHCKSYKEDLTMKIVRKKRTLSVK